MTRECITHHHACDCREAKFTALETEAEEQSRLIEKQAGDIAELRKQNGDLLASNRDCMDWYKNLELDYRALRQRIESAPIYYVPSRKPNDENGWANLIESVKNLNATRGKRVRLIVEDDA